MQLFRRIPLLLGWSVFYLSSLWPSWLLGLWVLPFLAKIFPRLTPTTSFISLMALNIILGFFMFGFSVGKVALPLYQNGASSAHEIAGMTFWSWLVSWFSYLVFYVVYCFPLAFHGWLPAAIEKPVYVLWQIIASFLAYRGVVRSWLDDFILRHKQYDKNQVVTAS